MAQSLLLSDRYYDPESDHRPTRDELEAVGRRIRAGEQPEWNDQVLAKLVAEQEALDGSGSPSWGRVGLLILGVFLLVAVSIATVVAVVILLRRMM